MTLFITVMGALGVVLGVGMFAWHLAGAWRGRSSGNLEYGVAPAISIMLGLIATEKAAGWPGWPFWLYWIMFVALPVALCAAIIGASKHRRAGR